MKPLITALLLTAALPAAAAEEDTFRPYLLTTKEAAEGWLSLFDGETTFGWRSPEGSTWNVVEGLLAPQAGKQRLLVTTAVFWDYEFKLQYRLRYDCGVKLLERCGREMGPTQTHELLELPFSRKAWAEVDVRRSPQEVTPTMKGVGDRFAYTFWGWKPSFPGGHLVLSGEGVVFRSLKVRPFGLKALFNGKDLAGWKENTTGETGTKFAVTDKGGLSVQGGPAVLQTEGQFDDFVLQLECKTTREHADGGVCLRATPGEASGYRVQVRNSWQGDDRTRPVDCGTGGIHGLKPARKVVSNDNEWFTLTAVVHGDHVAVWVNGYQTADFTDTRPESKKARKGPISLVGTDLAFRNVRIAPLPRAEKLEFPKCSEADSG
jgi:hypothetical protein